MSDEVAPDSPVDPDTTGQRQDAPRTEHHDPLRHSRTSQFWVALFGFGIVLVLMIVFIAQNTQSVEVSFFGWTGCPPLSVALLIAVAATILIMAVAGTLRILQLRRRVHQDKREVHKEKRRRG